LFGGGKGLLDGWRDFFECVGCGVG
jgi:hypothetical protein